MHFTLLKQETKCRAIKFGWLIVWSCYWLIFICRLVLQTFAKVNLVNFKRRSLQNLSLVQVILTGRISASLNLAFYIVCLKTYGLRAPLPLIMANTSSNLLNIFIVNACCFVRQFNWMPLIVSLLFIWISVVHKMTIVNFLCPHPTGLSAGYQFTYKEFSASTLLFWLCLFDINQLKYR
jgi:hypothetical protein